MVESQLAEKTTLDDVRGMVALSARVWPDEVDDVEATARRIHEKGPGEPDWRNWWIRRNGQIVAKAHTFARTIQDDSAPLRILALAGVCTDPACRGEGLAKAIVEGALALVDSGQYPAALFQTSSTVAPFYEKLGALRIPNEVVNSRNTEDPKANPFWDDVVMWYPSVGQLPVGPIDLQGPGY
ncbi:MAG: GNAT family N-acetyltransferase [Planctomycetota bacterium]